MQLVANPLLFVLVLGGLVLVAIFLLSRTTWRPSRSAPPGPPARLGPDAGSSGRMYVARWRLFVGLGVLFVPIGLLITLVQALVLHATNVLAVQVGQGSSGAVGVHRARARDDAHAARPGSGAGRDRRALVELDAGRPIGPLQAYGSPSCVRNALRGAAGRRVVVVALLASSLYLLPIAIWLAGRWAIVVPVVELRTEARSPRSAAAATSRGATG